MSCCTDTYATCIIRGDTWTLDVALSAAYVEVIDNPSDFQMTIVMRESQDDNLTPYLTLVGVPYIPDKPLVGEPPITYSFTATSDQTAALPQWDIVGYCELRQIADQVVNRLFNIEFEVGD